MAGAMGMRTWRSAAARASGLEPAALGPEQERDPRGQRAAEAIDVHRVLPRRQRDEGVAGVAHAL